MFVVVVIIIIIIIIIIIMSISEQQKTAPRVLSFTGFYSTHLCTLRLIFRLRFSSAWDRDTTLVTGWPCRSLRIPRCGLMSGLRTVHCGKAQTPVHRSRTCVLLRACS